MIVTVSGLSGLTNAYRSVISAAGSPEMRGASRWLEAFAPDGPDGGPRTLLPPPRRRRYRRARGTALPSAWLSPFQLLWSTAGSKPGRAFRFGYGPRTGRASEETRWTGSSRSSGSPRARSSRGATRTSPSAWRPRRVPGGHAARVRVLLGGARTRSSGSRSGTRPSRASATARPRSRPPAARRWPRSCRRELRGSTWAASCAYRRGASRPASLGRAR